MENSSRSNQGSVLGLMLGAPTAMEAALIQRLEARDRLDRRGTHRR